MSKQVKEGRGGRRAGAGRKAMDQDKKTVGISINLPPDLLTKLDDAASSSSKTRSKIVIEALGLWLAETPAPES